jgi:hypothetical protein
MASRRSGIRRIVVGAYGYDRDETISEASTGFDS